MRIASLPEIVGNGTTVYRVKRTSSKHWELAVKFTWLPPDTDPAKRPCEGKNAKARERKVCGVLFGFSVTIPLKSLRLYGRVAIQRLPATLQLRGTTRANAGPNRSTSQSAATEKTPFTPSNRKSSCSIVLRLGRPLQEFEAILQLLEALHDAMKGHGDLYYNRILYQDISVSNIMIPVASVSDNDPRGILVDLGLALEVENVLPDGRSCAGTPMFMAIGVLYNKSRRHTYCHDLEFFLCGLQ